MSEAKEGNNPDGSAIVPLKRKRGRPRKHPTLGLGDSPSPWGHNPNCRESFHTPPGFVGINGNQPRQADRVNNGTGLMVGQSVNGIIEAAFDAGYLLTVRVANSDTTLRGVVFKAGQYVPVSSDNDVAPGLQMIRRNVVPLPRKNCSHSSRSRERNGTVNAARVANPVASKGKLSPLATDALFPGNSRGNVVPVVLQPVAISNGSVGEPSSVTNQPDHAIISKGKQVLDDPAPSNGSTPLNQVHAVQTHLQFQFQDNHQASPPGTQDKAGFTRSLQEAKANPMNLPGMPFKKLLNEVIMGNQVQTQSTETDSSSAGKFSDKDSSVATEDDLNDSDQALSVEPLQTLQPNLHNHPANFVSAPPENCRTGKMTELLQENMNENWAAHAQNASPDPRPQLDQWESRDPEDANEEASGNSEKRLQVSSV